MSAATPDFAPFAARMRAEGLPDVVVQTFKYYYDQLVAGHTGLIAESDIEPVTALPDADALPDDLSVVGTEALAQTVVVKLNGGLGTSMGLDRAKTLLQVKKDLTFLDIIARQATRSGVPLVLMNSFNTQADSLAVLKNYPELDGNIPLDFLQHKVPKVRVDTLAPALYPDNPQLEWVPPGHGDIYTALVTSGMLATLLDAGYRYAFVSNADNLGAVMDDRILGHFVANQFPFMMEVADRTEADKKGGHLAQRRDGQLVLRESAQAASGDMAAFQDTGRHRYFNTNNLWLNLKALKDVLEERDNILGLPMIRNSKTINPRDAASAPVYQIETAMGSAIAVFSGASAIRVPRTRFAPVKTTSDLLGVRSDAYVLTDDFRIVANPARKLGQIVITLDSAFYKLIDRMEARFPYGAPSLLACETLDVKGDIHFGQRVTLEGNVRLQNDSNAPVVVADDLLIGGR